MNPIKVIIIITDPECSAEDYDQLEALMCEFYQQLDSKKVVLETKEVWMGV